MGVVGRGKQCGLEGCRLRIRSWGLERASWRWGVTGSAL